MFVRPGVTGSAGDASTSAPPRRPPATAESHAVEPGARGRQVSGSDVATTLTCRRWLSVSTTSKRERGEGVIVRHFGPLPASTALVATSINHSASVSSSRGRHRSRPLRCDPPELRRHSDSHRLRDLHSRQVRRLRQLRLVAFEPWRGERQARITETWPATPLNARSSSRGPKQGSCPCSGRRCTSSTFGPRSTRWRGRWRHLQPQIGRRFAMRRFIASPIVAPDCRSTSMQQPSELAAQWGLDVAIVLATVVLRHQTYSMCICVRCMRHEPPASAPREEDRAFKGVRAWSS